MAFDYKKTYKEFYLPPSQPSIIQIPAMNFLAVQGEGDPNTPAGAYQQAIGLLYGIAFTIKMSKRNNRHIEGYFDYVVPPLEGLWWHKGNGPIDYTHKKEFCWFSLIRLPDFVTRLDFDWAIDTATKKKKMDFSPVKFFRYEEGLCVQCMHLGSYDDEPATLRRMEQHCSEFGYSPDTDPNRYHHEIYLSDPRRVTPERRKTVIRIPIRKA